MHRTAGVVALLAMLVMLAVVMLLGAVPHAATHLAASGARPANGTAGCCPI